MTEEMKEAERTLYVVLILTPPEDGECVGFYATEGEARAAAGEKALREPGVEIAVFTRTASVRASLEAEWKGRAA